MTDEVKVEGVQPDAPKMNRKQRRAWEKKLKKLKAGDIKFSDRFHALPEDQQKNILLDILNKVKAKNQEYEVKSNGNHADEGNQDLED